METNRKEAAEFLKTRDVFRMRASEAPAKWADLVRACHANHWDDDDVVCDKKEAQRRALGELYPVAAPKQRKESEGCARCGGTGYIQAYSHIHNGKCASCWI